MFWNRFSGTLLCLLMACSLMAFGCGSDGATEKDNPAWQTAEEFDENVDVEPEPEPEPEPETEPEPQGLANGERCEADDDCQGGRCVPGPEGEDGYCADSCADTCGDGTACVATLDACAQTCESDDDCITGWACDDQGFEGTRVCVAPVGAPDGASCENDSDCQGGTCITDWPGGYCTTVGCRDFTDCARQGFNNKCLQTRGRDNLCVRICDGSESDTCRSDYICEPLSRQEGLCSPDPRQPLDEAVLNGNPFDVTCVSHDGEQLDIDYTIAESTTAYMITPFTPDGSDLRPDSISLPSGSTVDIRGSFQSVPSRIYGGMNPTVIPATAQRTASLEPGDHTYTVLSGADEVCWYLLEEDQPGNTIDLNVYLVGLDFDAAAAPNDPDMQSVLQSFDELYATAGVRLGDVRFYDVSGELAQQYAVVRNEAGLSTLVSSTERPGTELDDVLSANIFFVRAFALGGAIGISLGLPGPSGFHGTQGSGVLFTSEYMGRQTQDRFGNEVDGNIFTAQVLAHEVGHYLGLFHTSEQNGRSHDPLPDTPECGRISASCPDIGNLMFPFASAENETISPDQAFVIGVNPLTKFDPANEPPTDPEPDDGSTTDPMDDGMMTGGN